MPPSLSVLPGFFYTQLIVKPKYPTQSCKGKTIIVTGANAGLGYEAAKHFVRLGAEKVILACRSVQKGEDAKKSIEEAEKRHGVVEVWQLDLSSYDSVKAFVKRADELKRLDAIVENAGIATGKFVMTEGNESTITTNVISTFLLALLILPTLKRSAKTYDMTPTLTIVSSEVHSFTTFPQRNAQPSIFDSLNDPETADMEDRYPVSKLLEVLVCRELAQKPMSAPDYPVVLNCLNPGLCHSGLAHEIDQEWSMWIMKRLLARTTEMGSRTLVHAALAGKETHGEYMSDGFVAKPSAFVRSDEGKKAQERVWSELSRKLEAIQPGILQNL